jgi:Fe-S cluster biogenesis protein NfuA
VPPRKAGDDPDQCSPGGACSTCPAGMTGTLMAIEGILKKEVDPEIVVITV